MRHLIKLLIFGVLIAFCAGVSLAQQTGKISGRVYDAKTKDPLVGANVIIPELETGSATNMQGEFTLLRIYPGTYTVKVTYIGYATAVVKNVTVNIDRTTTLNIPMTSKALTSQEVVVTAEKPIVVKDKTYSSVQFDESEMRDLPTEGLRQVLDLNAGLERGANGTYSLRGGGAFDINFMIDGVTQGNSNTGVPGTNFMGERSNTSWKYDFNPIGVKQMELISGGFSAEYGNAQSGVVKIVTKEGTPDFHGEVRYENRPPGKYHFGDYLYSKNNVEWQDWGDIQDWYNYEFFQSEEDGNVIIDSTKAQQYYNKWLQWHTPSDTNKFGVYDYRDRTYQRILFGIGGPLSSKPGWTFFLSGERRMKPTRLPTYEQFVIYDNYNLTSVMKLSEKLRLRTMLQYQHDMSGPFSGSDDIRWASPVGNVSFNTGRQKYLLNRVAPKNEYSWIQSGVLTYVFSPKAYLEWTLSHTYELYEIDVEVLSMKYQVEQGPWDEGYTRLVYEPAATAYNQDSRTHKWATKLDYTNQITQRHQIKAGLQATMWDMHYTSASSAYVNAFLTRSGFAEYYKAQPVSASFYLQDRMEYEGMVANIGLRGDAYNNNVPTPVDEYDPFYPAINSNAIGNPETRKPKTNYALSPRIGLSFPIGEATAFRLQYGHFYSMPIFRHTLSRSTNQGWIMYGNPDLGFKKTISYEFGVQRSIAGTHRLDIAAYYNDRTRQTITVRRHMDTGSIARSNTDPYAATYLNHGYGATKGLEVELSKVSPGRWRYRLSYSLSRTSAGAYGPTEIWADNDPNKPFDMRPFMQRANDNVTQGDKTHSFTGILSYSLPNKSGLYLLGWYPFQNTNVSMTYTARSGIPYTYVTSYEEFQDVTNNRRYPLEYQTDMTITKNIPIYKTNLTFSVRIQNLFDNKWLTPFDPYVEVDDMQRWAEYGLTWDNPDHPNHKFNYFRTYRNTPREIYFIFGTSF